MGGAGWVLSRRGARRPAQEHYLAGKKFARLRQMDWAAREWQLATRLEPKFAEPYLALADLYRDAGALGLAAQTLERCAQANPRASHVQCRLAEVYYLQKRLPQAFPAAQRAAKADKDCARAHAVWGMILADNESHRDALKELEKAHRLAPDHVGITLTLAQMQVANMQFDRAEKLTRQVLKEHPDSADAHYLLGWMHGRVGLRDARRAREAISHLQRALELNPQHLKALAELGRVYSLLNRPREAKPLLEKAWKMDSTMSHVAYHLALVYQKLGDPRAAQMSATFRRLNERATRWQALRKRYGLDPHNPAIGLELAKMERDRGAYTDALALLQEILRKDPDNKPALDLMHEILPKVTGPEDGS
jgi:tetratricopeptide (TPR) repeat protein